MSAKAKQEGRNPFEESETGQTQNTIKRLVATASDPAQPEQASQRKRPRYPSEAKRVDRRVSLDLDPDVKSDLYDLVETVATKRQLSAISQALLEYALFAYHSGHLELRPSVGPTGIRFEVVTPNGSEN